MTKLYQFFCLLSIFLLTNVGGAFAQIQIEGIVTDKKSGEPLLGVIVQHSKIRGVSTDANGYFNIEILDTTGLELSFRLLGYRTLTLRPSFKQVTVLAIALEEETSILNTVVVTSSLYERKIEREVASIEVIQPRFFEKNAFTSLSDAMERTPGVQIIEDQVNIRGSGYSFGAGSRVGVIVDGMPQMGALAGDIKWNFIPIENVSQVEVVKGAASVLYGATSMNGVINVTTADPVSKPYTSLAVYRGIMDSPRSEYRQWWNDTLPPGNVGLFFAHRVKATKKLDVSLGGNVHFNRAHIERGDELRYRLNWKTKYRASDRLTLGFNGNVMYHKLGWYFIWQDADTNALRHISPIAFNRYRTVSLDPHLTYFDKNGNKHSLKGRYFNTTISKKIINQPDAPAVIWGADYQFQKEFKRNLIWTSGVSYMDFFADDPTFPTNTSDTITLPRQKGRNASLMSQADWSPWGDKFLLSAGGRLDYFQIGTDDFQAVVPVYRVAANYQPNRGNVFRASFGQGYRVPSLQERYIQATLFVVQTPFFDIPLQALPNYNIVPEFGWNFEIGYKKLFDASHFKGYLDATFFLMEYENMGELAFDLHAEDISNLTINQILDSLGFKYVNNTHGRIAGLELSAFLNIQLGRVPIRFWGGYTYTYPGDLDSLELLQQNYWTNFADALYEPSEAMLPTIMRYRSLHSARLDIEFEFFKRLTLGFNATFNGFVPNIDDIFEGQGRWGELVQQFNNGPLIPDLPAFRASQIGGDWVFDARLAFAFSPQHEVFFIVTNFTNREYALRVGRMNPLRMFNLKYQIKF